MFAVVDLFFFSRSESMSRAGIAVLARRISEADSLKNEEGGEKITNVSAQTAASLFRLS